MSETQTYTGTLIVFHCFDCAIPYAVPEDFDTRNLRDGRTWYCPQGHATAYKDPETAQLKREITRLTHTVDQVRADREACIRRERATERSLNATKGVVTKIKRRVGNGVCPCCNRTFGDLARHMGDKHPTWRSE